MAVVERIGLDWPLTSITGWGVVGLYLATAMCRQPGPKPVLFRKSQKIEIDPLRQRLLRPYLSDAERFAEQCAGQRRPVVKAQFPVLHALGNRLGAQPDTPARGTPDIGLLVLESTRIDADAREQAKRYVTIAAGSRWVEGVAAAAGIAGVTTIQQGVDPSLFHPGPKMRPFRDRFVVFSGGKIEYRKAQDLVVEAFRRFQARHPEALLITCWQNPWAELSASIIAGRIVRRPPAPREGLGIDVEGWVAAAGVPKECHIDVDFVPNGLMPPVIREADVAVFPNRCEGGTNLVAMECMASGVPTILSANTGHLDLLAGPDVAIPLRRQRPTTARVPDNMGMEGWGESDIDEIVEALETVHRDRADAAARGRRAAAWMAERWNWDRHTERVMALVASVA